VSGKKQSPNNAYVCTDTTRRNVAKPQACSMVDGLSQVAIAACVDAKTRHIDARNSMRRGVARGGDSFSVDTRSLPT